MSAIRKLERGIPIRFYCGVPRRIDSLEQVAFARTFADMEAEIATRRAKFVQAHNLKQGMVQELLTGRIRLV